MNGDVIRAEPAAFILLSLAHRLGDADLATVDALIAVGIAYSHAKILRCAVGRIREHRAYAQLQDRVHEISDLRAQFWPVLKIPYLFGPARSGIHGQILVDSPASCLSAYTSVCC